MAFDRVEPIGERAWDVRWAALMSLLINLAQMFIPKAQRKPVSPEEFLPKYWQQEPEPVEQAPMSSERMLAMAEMWNAALGGKDLRKHDHPSDTAGKTNR